jgi:hypothetical protein
MELNLVPGDITSRIMMLANGNLLITNVNSNDAGFLCSFEMVLVYICFVAFSKMYNI